ncbi:MAG TPA: J domain-containing protein [Pyrinomonadaceae bacterium]|nr:J domain-containing protein [Pyrinomonadaceae bacterium]
MNEERYHETLGLRPGATREELKTAYRDMAKVWHPDRFAHDPRLQSMAQEKLKEINEAYKQLTSPRPARARRPTHEPHAAHADATYRARPRHGSPPPVIIIRETRARRSLVPAVAAVVVAAVTFFAAARLFTNRPGATADAAPAASSSDATAGRDSAELSSADAQRDRKTAARQKASDAAAGADVAPAAPARALPTVTRAVDPTTGLLATRVCPARALMTYPAGSEPQSSCNAEHAPKASAPRPAQAARTQDARTTAGASPASPSEAKEKSRLKSVVGTLASPGKWFKKKKEKPPAP